MRIGIPQTDAAGLLAALLLTSSVATAAPIVVVSGPFGGGGGDNLGRGFYVEHFGADNLSTVTLKYLSLVTGTSETQLTVRLDTYDGPLVGVRNLTTDLVAGHSLDVTYDFGGLAVPFDSLLTFAQRVVTGPFPYYDVGPAGLPPHPQITQTNGTVAPLDFFRRSQVGVIITAEAAPVPEPASLLLFGTGLVGLRAWRKRR